MNSTLNANTAASGNQQCNEEESAPVILHPLVVMNVSDHYTRYRAMRLLPINPALRTPENSPEAPVLHDSEGEIQVLGLLLGKQLGRTVEVCHSFELSATAEPGGPISVDMQFMDLRIQQYRQIFAQYSLVGWYRTGTRLSKHDKDICERVFADVIESPIFLLVNGNSSIPGSANQGNTDGSASHKRELLQTFMTELHLISGTAQKELAAVPHRFASEDSERIAVDHVMRHAVPDGTDGTSGTALHLWTLRRSIRMLKEKIELILLFLDDVMKQNVKHDHNLLRKISGICTRLYGLDSQEFSEAFADERHDSLIVTYLGGLTKSLCSMNDVLERYTKANERTFPGPVDRNYKKRGSFLRTVNG